MTKSRSEIRTGAKLIVLNYDAPPTVELAAEGLRGTADGAPGRTQCLRLEDGRDVLVDASDLTEAS